MMLHTAEALLEVAWECAHASDEYRDEDEVAPVVDYSLLFPLDIPEWCEDDEYLPEGAC